MKTVRSWLETNYHLIPVNMNNSWLSLGLEACLEIVTFELKVLFSDASFLLLNISDTPFEKPRFAKNGLFAFKSSIQTSSDSEFQFLMQPPSPVCISSGNILSTSNTNLVMATNTLNFI